MDQKKFVEIIKRFPQIWDRSHPYFRDKDIKENAWISIENEIGFPADTCKDTFKSIREKYIRERDKSTQKYSKEWELLSKLKFLDPNIVPRKQSFDNDLQKAKEHKSEINKEMMHFDVMSQTKIDKALISSVKKTTPLWDRNSNTHPNKNLKLQLWENIAKTLGMDNNVCMLRWKALREKYIRQKMKIQIEGDKWELLEDMAFLDKVIQYRKKIADDYCPEQLSNETIRSCENQKIASENETNYYQGSHNYDPCDENSLNDSSNDLITNVKLENTTVGIADSSSRKRSASYDGVETLEKKQPQEKNERKRCPEELFGDLVAAMLHRKPEKDRNMYMIEIMTVLTK